MKKISLLICLSFLLASCSAPATGPAAAPTVTVTQTVTPAPVAAVPAKAPLAPGTTVTVRASGTTATFYAFKQIKDEYNKDIAAFEVQVCVGEDPKDGQSTPGVSSQRWSLRDSNNGVYQGSTGYTGNPVSPLYPNGDGALNWGECARGWIIMPVVEGTNITEARYTSSDNKVFSWRAA